MTIGAGCWNVCSLVAWICCGRPIGLMTFITVFGKTGKRTIRMTAGTIEGVTLRQWEKRVIYIGGAPGDAVYRMALNTICRKLSLDVIWVFGILIIVAVAIITQHPNGFKTEQRSGFVTICAIGVSMGSNKRETAALMNFCYIFHNPGFCSVAPGAIRTDGLVMHIGVTIDAGGFGFRKHQRWMTCPAIYYLVLTAERKSGFIVIKSVDLFIQLPAI
jgi:hypothetical protein